MIKKRLTWKYYLFESISTRHLKKDELPVTFSENKGIILLFFVDGACCNKLSNHKFCSLNIHKHIVFFKWFYLYLLGNVNTFKKYNIGSTKGATIQYILFKTPSKQVFVKNNFKLITFKPILKLCFFKPILFIFLWLQSICLMHRSFFFQMV